MAKKVESKPNAGAADPTADNTADKPTHNVINASPGAVGSDDGPKAADKPAGVINTTENEYDDGLPSEAPRRQLTEADRKEIKAEAQKSGAVISNIANKFDIEPSEVFAIAEGK